MLAWQELVLCSDEQLAARDVAETNLACAVGLPDAGGMNPALCISTLDYWSRRVEEETRRLLPQFHRKPFEYENSEAYFRILCMITVLQRDLGVRYNPAKIPVDVPLDTADVFIHGVIQGDGGTCTSLPVVYVAVGRRLGYPLKLVSAKAGKFGHYFARWEDGKERFNIEATSKGLRCEPDDYYRTGVYALTAEHEREGWFLRSLTPRQELASFLAERGFRLLELGNYHASVEAFTWACALHPEKVSLERRLIRTCNAWGEILEKVEPPGFPRFTFANWPPRRFPETLPEDIEHHYFKLWVIDRMLRHPDHHRTWWAPMKRGQRVPGRPVAATVVCGETGFEVQFRLSDN